MAPRARTSSLEAWKLVNAILLQFSDVTGPADATKGLVSIFDIFVYVDQTLQGANILATSNEHQQYQTFAPDWFKGSPVQTEG